MQALLPWILGGLFLFTLWGNMNPAPVAEDMTKVPLKSSLQWSSHDEQDREKADATARFTHKESGLSLGVALFDGGRELRISNEDATKWEYTGKRYSAFWDQSYDIGAWVAARPDVDPGYDVGIRLSPVRLLYGTLSPDLLVGSRSAGVGVSAYVPPGYIPRSWDRFGLGFGYLSDYSSGAAGYAAYLSLSTRY